MLFKGYNSFNVHTLKSSFFTYHFMLWALSQWSVQDLSPEPLLKCFEPTGGSTAQCKWTIVAPYQSGTHFKDAKLWSCSLRVHFTGTHTSGTSNPELRDNVGPVREWDLTQSWRHLPIITCHLPERSGHDPSFIQANRKFSPLYHFRSQGRHTCALSVFSIWSSFLKPKGDWKMSIFTKASLNNNIPGELFLIFWKTRSLSCILKTMEITSVTAQWRGCKYWDNSGLS